MNYDDAQALILYKPKHPQDAKDSAIRAQHVVRFPFEFERTLIYDGRLWEADRWRPYYTDSYMDSLPHDWYKVPEKGPLRRPEPELPSLLKTRKARENKKAVELVENGVMPISRVLQYYMARAKKFLLTPTDRRMLRRLFSSK